VYIASCQLRKTGVQLIADALYSSTTKVHHSAFGFEFELYLLLIKRCGSPMRWLPNASLLTNLQLNLNGLEDKGATATASLLERSVSIRTLNFNLESLKMVLVMTVSTQLPVI
jgi:hypothetical protein